MQHRFVGAPLMLATLCACSLPLSVLAEESSQPSSKTERSPMDAPTIPVADASDIFNKRDASKKLTAETSEKTPLIVTAADATPASVTPTAIDPKADAVAHSTKIYVAKMLEKPAAKRTEKVRKTYNWLNPVMRYTALQRNNASASTVAPYTLDVDNTDLYHPWSATGYARKAAYAAQAAGAQTTGGQATGGKDTPNTKAAQTPPTTPASTTPTSRALPSPIDNPPFPISDWVVNNGYPIGESWDVPAGPLQHAIFGHSLDKSRITVTGWLDTGIVFSTSNNSNLPYTYNLVPNHPQLDQFVIEIQRQPDTTQKDHIDWGFMSAHLFGIDYRFTSAKGYLDDQLLSHNNLYGYDPVLQYGMLYLPKVADGTVIQAGRYISPVDIEAQLSPSNYLYSHSLMFGVDPYTYTGINAQIRFSKYFQILVGVHGGNENVWWSGATNINGEFLLGWNSADNKDSIWGGLDSIGDGKTRKQHDNEQILTGTWGHKFNDRFHMQTQAYYMFQYDPLMGGTPSYGNSYPYAAAGPGTVIKGKAYAQGFVNNLEYKLNKKDYISFRNDYLNDPQGWRTGAINRYSSHTLGFAHNFNSSIVIRPEIRYEHAYDNPAFDLGTKKEQFTFATDVIFKF